MSKEIQSQKEFQMLTNALNRKRKQEDGKDDNSLSTKHIRNRNNTIIMKNILQNTASSASKIVPKINFDVDKKSNATKAVTRTSSLRDTRSKNSLITNRMTNSTRLLTSRKNSTNSTTGTKRIMKKRPAWDTKGRLQDLEMESKENKKLIEELLKNLSGKIKIQEKDNNELKQVQIKTTETNKSLTQKIEELTELIETLRERNTNLESNLKPYDELRNKNTELEGKIKNMDDSIKLKDEEINKLNDIIKEQITSITILKNEELSFKTKIETKDCIIKTKDEEIEKMKHEIEVLKEQYKTSNRKRIQEESLRRKMHNEILELKGNIRVFCRVRPVLTTETNGKPINDVVSDIQYPDDERKIVLKQQSKTALGNTVPKLYPFSFDKVFQDSASQGEIFEDISQLVQSALDGYNVCIFAYGQTGSGKTYTMEGISDDPEKIGMIPRAVKQIFVAAEELKEKGWKYEMEGQYLEIYNETVRDLLGNGDLSKKHEIKHNLHTGKTVVTDTTVIKVHTPEQVHNLLKKAQQNRAVGATLCNERSSRSHSVFIFKLSGVNSITEDTCEGTLNLIDLAGSERLSQSGATGDRLKETQAINKSLSCLSDVIAALANKDPHIPYRNSKLTYLLQNSLGGNSKTLMFVNISPLAYNFQETICSLRFATKVNKCQIGTAKRSFKS
ncbi:kinesin-domain-containing protein [Neocallimastix lanati (nom. inval.)]|nr:kinesin-domain-containing protein [Neocallimastix sp. JGI-2020a]